MSHTNSTTNYGLPQWIGSDKPTFLGDFNSAFNTIDGQMKQNSTDAGQAVSTANAANATANEASERSITAKNTADTAKDTADAANALATTASNTATVAKNTADAAARTAEANNVANLAPAYDPTLTYNVGDLVTYIDENNSGKLYKCIVAWETPGAFNINYWDDVTVSEVIDGNVIFTETLAHNTVKFSTFLSSTLFPLIDAAINGDPKKKARLIVNLGETSGTSKFIFKLSKATYNSTAQNNEYDFDGSQCFLALGDGKAHVSHYNMKVGSSAALSHYYQIGIISTDAVDTDPGTGNIVSSSITQDIKILDYYIPSSDFIFTLVLE